MSYSVKLNGITKKYKMHRQNSDKLKDIILPGGYGEDFYAIRDLTFEAGKGDVVGIIGVNGSGKSTFSNLVANITPPTSGEIDVKGDVSLIAVSAGLNKELTGRENIELKLLMMGYKKNKIEEMKPDIIEFADIGKFIDMPVKKYSSGMKSRLGFSISISVDPDVLIVDEALSVGDKTFADKCLVKMNEFKERGKTIFFVSHSNGQMKKFCNKALWLEHGTIREYGPMKEVMPHYEAFIKEYKSWSKEEKRRFREEGTKKQEGLATAESASSEEKEKRKKSWILF
ncbi:teichoic acids export protein ATP-binding subunit [Alkalihalobacillus macyae]|uniref:Teichoic acids export protein ATP-binding subunit n=2 Tax=Guptibacillus hwajinpoensis TaxID=208199 RepID=A0A0J6CUK8_9BACL|nr:teichoic acids export protein ATP-binding subunit [Alkalihalobacillus macyae]MDQ0482620.1 teichoic acid transport system ATP-binding protein [Alkalihalobacillus hemicentroti]